MAQLHPVADPSSPEGGRDLLYLFNTRADKLRFVIDIDMRTGVDYLHLAVRLAGRNGMAPHAERTRVLFAIQTAQGRLLFPQGRWVARPIPCHANPPPVATP